MVAPADQAVAEAMRSHGWTALTRGWPDILAWHEHRRIVIGVELKRGNDPVSPGQVAMQRAFERALGVPYVIARDADIDYLVKGRIAGLGAPAKTMEVRDRRAFSEADESVFPPRKWRAA